MFEKYYRDIICEDLILKENITNLQSISKFVSLTVNYSSGVVVNHSQYAVPVLTGFQLISGQKAKKTKAKKSVSGFQIRQDQLLGCKLTLRKDRLLGFLEKLVFTILPRLHFIEQKKISQSDYNFGIVQTLIFPELENHSDSFEFLKGCDIQLVTSSNSQESSRLLLSSLKFVTKQM